MRIISELSLRIHILRYRIWLRRTLPAAAINRVKIAESGEPMVNIRGCRDLFLADELMSRETVCVRRGVYERLVVAARALPAGYGLKIMSAHRPIAEQAALWDKQMERTRRENPTASPDLLIQINRRLVAQPHHGFGGHQTGGAVDVTLCDENGVDMGLGKWLGPVRGDADVRRLRRVLRRAMCAAGFVNYPAEWWHFCYGDRMWAAYTRHAQCPYGLIE